MSALFFVGTWVTLDRYVTQTDTLNKFADDSVIVSLLQGEEHQHGLVVDDFVVWCDESFLQIMCTKQKDMLINFRRTTPTSVLTINSGGADVDVEGF